MLLILYFNDALYSNEMTRWPSGLRRNVKAVVFIGVGSNPTRVTFLLVRLHVYRTPRNCVVMWAVLLVRLHVYTFKKIVLWCEWVPRNRNLLLLVFVPAHITFLVKLMRKQKHKNAKSNHNTQTHIFISSTRWKYVPVFGTQLLTAQIAKRSRNASTWIFILFST